MSAPSKLLDMAGKWIWGTSPSLIRTTEERIAYRVFEQEQRSQRNINPAAERLRGAASSLPTQGDFDRVFQRGSTYRAGTEQSVGQQSIKWVDCTPRNADGTLNTGATVVVSVDWKRGCRQYLYLDQNRNIYLLNPLDQTCCLLVWQRKDGGGATITFMDSFADPLYPKIYWMGGVAPTMTTTENAFDMYSLTYIEALKLYTGMWTQDLRVRTA